MTTPRELAVMAKMLPHQAQMADTLGCDPSKVSKAFRGYVKEERFMIRLEREIRSMLSNIDTVATS